MIELNVVLSNKRSRRIFYFEALQYSTTAIRGCGLKEGGTFLQVRKAIQMRFQNFVIFSFQITANNYRYNNIYYYIFQNCQLSALFSCLQTSSINILTLRMQKFVERGYTRLWDLNFHIQYEVKTWTSGKPSQKETIDDAITLVNI